jgi:hypothetical protein
MATFFGYVKTWKDDLKINSISFVKGFEYQRPSLTLIKFLKTKENELRRSK